MNAIEVKGLAKKFNGFAAVDGINFEIKEGEIFGLLGPNGAGKTTTISMLSTILKPTSGSATINGFNLATQQNDVRMSIGIVFQDPSLDDELTGRENLDFHGRLYGVNSKERKEKIKAVLELVELEEKADSQVKTYSGGMKRRLELARGLIHMPKILFLDEPTIGLDPQTRRKLWEYIKRINSEKGTTMILTTHYMEEADFLCNRIAIVDKGKIIASNTPEKLKQVLGGDVITLEASEPESLKKVVGKMAGINEVTIFGDKLNVTANNGSTVLPRIIKVAHDNGVSIRSATLKSPSLEDVFIHYTGRAIREEEADSKNAMRLRMRVGWR